MARELQAAHEAGRVEVATGRAFRGTPAVLLRGPAVLNPTVRELIAVPAAVREDRGTGRRERGAQALPYKVATAWRAPRIRSAVTSGCSPNS